MADSPSLASAQALARTQGNQLVVELSGTWSITAPHPSWADLAQLERKPKIVQIVMAKQALWDSALVLFVAEAARWSRENSTALDLSALPEGVTRLLAQFSATQVRPLETAPHRNLLYQVGTLSVATWSGASAFSYFLGETILGFWGALRQPRRFRWRDCLAEMQACGAMALPIVGLINFLAGITLAYTGAVILRQFGVDILVADLVGLSMVREMGPVMTAVILSGRTGAAFAAEIGNMKANEEVDALVTFGFSPTNFLVLPRVFALAVMMPLLVLYANGMGIIGGMIVARGVLQIPPAAYWLEMLTIVTVKDVSAGLIKAVTFGLIVGLAGCMRGLQAERSAAGVGRAATSAVVTAILFLVVADSIYAVIFNILGL